MEANSGARETGGLEYDEEVLNAGWLLCSELHLQQVAGCGRRLHKPRLAVDPDEFLRGIYRLQE